VDELPAPADKAAKSDALEEGAALHAALDDVGDGVVEAVEEKLEAGQAARGHQTLRRCWDSAADAHAGEGGGLRVYSALSGRGTARQAEPGR
jgi:hypothetical protein